MFYYQLNLSDELYSLTQIFVVVLVTMSSTVDCEGANTNWLSSSENCKLMETYRRIQVDGCYSKRIQLFSCVGACTSYSQVSEYDLWRMERSCMCCRESGEIKVSVSVFCPSEQKFKEVIVTRPEGCMCRPCTGIDERSVIPQEMVIFPNEPPINGHFTNY